MSEIVTAIQHERQKEHRLVLRNIGRIDPASIEEYIEHGGYEALRKALTLMRPSDIIQAIKASGLRDRDREARFAGVKWETTANAPGDIKYIICNSSNGEPGDFNDIILESDPHSILESMIITGYAVGAHTGYICINGECQSSDHLDIAIATARQSRLLGDDILGSGFDFDIKVFTGASGYICGEGTALIESIEGNRGEPRYQPPFPEVSGLYGMPTIVHNVETLANVRHIIRNGAEWYTGIGTSESKGTKIFSVRGDARYPGIYEVPFGTTMREVIYELAGGMKSDKRLKAVLVGGPSGICVSEEALDRQFAFEDLAPGVGELIVLDEAKCMLNVVQNIAQFFFNESCGQCTPCREGNKRILETMTRWTTASGHASDIDLIRNLGEMMALTAKCGLGQCAPSAFLTSLPLFEKEYIAHLSDGVCPSGVCATEASEECQACKESL